MAYVVWPVLAGAFSQRFHERPLLGLKHTLERQVHQAGTVLVHLPLEKSLLTDVMLANMIASRPPQNDRK
jgi:hypothetical protein